MSKEKRPPDFLKFLFGFGMIWGLFWPGNIALSLDSSNYPTREVRIGSSDESEPKPGLFHQFEVTCLEHGREVTTCNPHWESSDERVAVISQTGLLLRVNDGLAVICVSWSIKEKNIQQCVPIEIQSPEPPPPPRRPLVGAKVVAKLLQRGPSWAPFPHHTSA